MIRRLLLTAFILAPQLLHARSVLMDPRPAQVGFAQKVTAYVNGVQSKTSKDGVGQVLSKAVFLTPHSAMKSVTTILNELGPHLIRDKSVAEQEACSASLIKLLVPIVTQFEAVLFNGVRTIERSLEYWQEQGTHPVSYFFHKSLIKYFTFDQKEEVSEKIQVLKTMREQHFELLGRVNIHLSSFDGQIAVQDQYLWIQKLCRVLFAYDETLHVAQDAEIFPLLYEATNIVSQYKTRMHERLKTYQIPSLFARRWMELTTATAGVTYGGWYGCTHQETLRHFRDDAGRRWQDIKEIVRGRTDDKAVKEEYSVYKLRWYWLQSEHERVRDVQEKITKSSLPKSDPNRVPIERSALVRMMMGAYLNIGAEGFRRFVQGFAEIGHAFADGRQQAGLAEKVANYFVSGTDTVRENVGSVASTLSDRRRRTRRTSSSSSSSSSAAAADVVEEDAVEEDAVEEELPFTVEESLLHELPNTAKLWFALQKVEHPRAWGLIRSAPFTIPSSIFAWKMSKALYRRYTKLPDCEPIRIALVDIALILNVYGDASPEEMDASDFGRLAYLAHKLEFDIALIPKKYRESFLIEIGLLRTSSLNAQQKMKVIDLMYKKYPFLAFQGMITA